MDNLLSDDSEVLKNPINRKEHRMRLKKLLSDYGDTLRDVDSRTQYEYYFSHCRHSIHVYDKDDKTERMFNLRGLYSALMACFSILAIIALVKMILSVIAYGLLDLSKGNVYVIKAADWMNLSSTEDGILFLAFSCIVFAVLAMVNNRSYRNYTRFWMEMVLDVYQASTDRNNMPVICEEK